MNSKLRATEYLGLLVALAISALYVWFTFGYPFIAGNAPFWLADSEDITQYIAGFNMYFSSPWHFPLLAFDSLNYPEGTRATFVDAIPLYSLILKIFLPSSMAPFNPFGVWVALCFIIQGLAAWWIARELRVNSWAFLLALVAIFLTYPALLFRLGHISLMSQWILLFAIAIYIRTWRMQALPVYIWTIFLVSSFYINIYLFVMASGIYLAALLSIKPLKVRNFLLFVVPYLVLVGTMFVLLLPLTPSGVATDTGFGYYSMNLLSPFIGGRILDVQASVMPGQYEGFNYLGLGVIIACFIALALKRKHSNRFMYHHWALVSLLIGYTIYSLASHVYFGQQLVMLIHYPSQLDSLVSQFRATGRFFWPVGYCLIIFSFFSLYRYFKSWVFGTIAVVLVFVQVLDVSKHYQNLKFKINHSHQAKMNYTAWDEVLSADTKTLYFYPKFRCGGDPQNTLLPIMKYAATKNLQLSTGYVSRYQPDCEDYPQEIARSSRSDSAYVFVKSVYTDLAGLNKFFPIDAPPVCNEVDFAYVCR